jgi:serine protease Do
MTNGSSILRAVAVALTAMAFAAGCSKADLPLFHGSANAATPAVAAPSNGDRSLPAVSAPLNGDRARPPVAALPDFSALVERYGPAVVNVTVTETPERAADRGGNPAQPRHGMSPDDPFWQFFRHFHVPPQQQPVLGVGSGFIVSPDGTILTNAHVVDNAKNVVVRLTDRREFSAKVIGTDERSDVAVLKIDATNLPTVKLGDSSKVKVGSWVVAIGSPYGFDNTVTAGIVSAKARSLGEESYVPFLQTDVPLNPGNSGGPLFDLNGEVVGINAQIYSRSGGFQGLSFAIPIDIALKVEQQLVQSGHVVYGRLGVTIQAVNQGLADSFGLQSPKGALVSAVEAGSPAAKAGLQPGDVILNFEGRDVNQTSTLPEMVAALKPGTKATMEIWRNGATRELSATIGELKQETVASASSDAATEGNVGLAVRPLTPQELEQAGVSNGLVVGGVAGAAAQAGIERGDVILAFNGTPVRSVAQLRELVAKAGKHFALLVKREDATIFVPIDVG